MCSYAYVGCRVMSLSLITSGKRDSKSKHACGESGQMLLWAMLLFLLGSQQSCMGKLVEKNHKYSSKADTKQHLGLHVFKHNRLVSECKGFRTECRIHITALWTNFTGTVAKIFFKGDFNVKQ